MFFVSKDVHLVECRRRYLFGSSAYVAGYCLFWQQFKHTWNSEIQFNSAHLLSFCLLIDISQRSKNRQKSDDLDVLHVVMFSLGFHFL